MPRLRDLTYNDALTILTGKDSRIVNLIDNVLCYAILASIPFSGPGALSLIGPKNEVRKITESALGGFGAKLRGLRVVDRTERIEAANQVLVVHAILEATSDILGAPWMDLRVTDVEVSRLLGAEPTTTTAISPAVDLLGGISVPTPEPAESFNTTLQAVEDLARSYTAPLWRFFAGLAMWGDRDASYRAKLRSEIERDLPALSRSKYEANFRRLAGDVPELAVWANLREHGATHSVIADLRSQVESTTDRLQSTSTEILNDLRSMRSLLSSIIDGISGPKRQAIHDLANHYLADLERPLLDVTDDELSVLAPTISKTFVEPSCKVMKYSNSSLPAEEIWWERIVEIEDTQRLIAAFLTTPAAKKLPMLILGHPGAGKSVLTKVLASQLDPQAFLPIRVPLRDVVANGTVQEQIDQALYLTLQGKFTWTQLSRNAEELFPVIFLDGLDELIQASGASKSNYLEMVRDFQWTAESQDRPVAVIVTSRTAVADIARIPVGATVLKLQPFDRGRIDRWIRQWNTTFASRLTAMGVQPLREEVVARNQQLASHPILLLMLALYDADGNGLSDERLTFSEAALYEKLITRFIRREVLKISRDLSTEQITQSVEQQIYHLSIIALAMFNRGEQIVRQNDVDRDLSSVIGFTSGDRPENFEETLRPGDRMVGRFFFLNHSVARRRPVNAPLSSNSVSGRSIEFVHSTFGEFLVARLAVALVSSAERTVAPAHPWESATTVFNDDMLRMFFCAQPLTKRRQVVVFVSELVKDVDAKRVSHTIEKLFARSLWPGSHAGLNLYQPRDIDVPAKHAYYSANLVILYAAVLGKLDVKRFLQVANDEFRMKWRKLVLLWESRFDRDAWLALVSLLRMTENSKSKLVYQFELEPTLTVPETDQFRSHLERFGNSDGLQEKREKGADLAPPAAVFAVGSNAHFFHRRRNELSGDFITGAGVRTLCYLGEVVGRFADAIIVAPDGWADNELEQGNADGLLGAQLLAHIAYPSFGDSHVSYMLALDAIDSTPGLCDVRTARQLMRQVSLDEPILPISTIERALRICLQAGPAEPDVDFFRFIVLTATRSMSRCLDVDTKESMSSFASEAYGRLDALHLVEFEPAAYIELIIAIEECGVSASDIASEFGSFEDHVRRVSVSI